MTLRPSLGWGWLLASGLCSILVGVILLTGWPATALWLTGLLLGVNLVFTGAMNASLVIAFTHEPVGDAQREGDGCEPDQLFRSHLMHIEDDELACQSE